MLDGEDRARQTPTEDRVAVEQIGNRGAESIVDSSSLPHTISEPSRISNGPCGSASTPAPQSSRSTRTVVSVGDASPWKIFHERKDASLLSTLCRIRSINCGASSPPSVMTTLDAPTPAANRPHAPVPAPSSSTAAPHYIHIRCEPPTEYRCGRPYHTAQTNVFGIFSGCGEANVEDAAIGQRWQRGGVHLRRTPTIRGARRGAMLFLASLGKPLLRNKQQSAQTPIRD